MWRSKGELTLIIPKNNQCSRTDNNEKWTLKETLMYFLDNCGTLKLDTVQTFKTCQSEIYISDGECVDAQVDFKINTRWSRTQHGLKKKPTKPSNPCSSVKPPLLKRLQNHFSSTRAKPKRQISLKSLLIIQFAAWIGWGACWLSAIWATGTAQVTVPAPAPTSEHNTEGNTCQSWWRRTQTRGYFSRPFVLLMLMKISQDE